MTDCERMLLKQATHDRTMYQRWSRAWRRAAKDYRRDLRRPLTPADLTAIGMQMQLTAFERNRELASALRELVAYADASGLAYLQDWVRRARRALGEEPTK